MEIKPLPKELYEFFKGKAGRSLIIKGLAGTGKTILSLTILEEIAKIENSFYFSTRVSNQSLYSQFSWLKDRDFRENLIDASMDFLKSIYSPDELLPHLKQEKVKEREDKIEKVDKARRILDKFKQKGSLEEIILPENVSRTHLTSIMKGTDIIELEEVYSRVDSRLPEPSLIIIDSLESLVERYGVDTSSLIKALQKDLVEISGTKLILVLEKEESTKWDYLVDGVVTLRMQETEGRRIRKLILNKLRGIPIGRPVYLYTLEEGRFNYLPPFDANLSLVNGTRNIIKDGPKTESWKKMKFSSGNIMLDDILDGGYPHNGLVVMEFTSKVPFSGRKIMFGPLMANFLRQGRGVLFIPSSKDRISFEKGTQDIVDESVRKSLKVFEPEKRSSEGEDLVHNFKETYRELKFRTDSPVLTVCDWIRLEHLIDKSGLSEDRGTTLAKELLDIMKENSGLTVLMMRPGFTFTEDARYVADIHINIFTEYNSLLMSCEKPNTSIYNISTTGDKTLAVWYIKLV